MIFVILVDICLQAVPHCLRIGGRAPVPPASIARLCNRRRTITAAPLHGGKLTGYFGTSVHASLRRSDALSKNHPRFGRKKSPQGIPLEKLEITRKIHQARMTNRTMIQRQLFLGAGDQNQYPVDDHHQIVDRQEMFLQTPPQTGDPPLKIITVLH